MEEAIIEEARMVNQSYISRLEKLENVVSDILIKVAKFQVEMEAVKTAVATDVNDDKKETEDMAQMRAEVKTMKAVQSRNEKIFLGIGAFIVIGLLGILYTLVVAPLLP